MKIKYMTFALVGATINLLGDQPFKMPVQEKNLEADIIVLGVELQVVY